MFNCLFADQQQVQRRVGSGMPRVDQGNHRGARESLRGDGQLLWGPQGRNPPLPVTLYSHSHYSFACHFNRQQNFLVTNLHNIGMENGPPHITILDFSPCSIHIHIIYLLLFYSDSCDMTRLKYLIQLILPCLLCRSLHMFSLVPLSMEA